jgi:hypothetical protein
MATAGESATLRGMELAAAQDFDVKVVALEPAGPGRRPDRRGEAGRGEAVRAPPRQVEARARDRQGYRAVGVPRPRAGVARAAGRLALGDRPLGTMTLRAAVAARAAAASPRVARPRPGRARRSPVRSYRRCGRSSPAHASTTDEEANRAVRALVDGAALDPAGVALRRARRARRVRGSTRPEPSPLPPARRSSARACPCDPSGRRSSEVVAPARRTEPRRALRLIPDTPALD